MSNSVSKGRVSVVVPFYNSERWLPSLISSLKNQSYKDFELIAVNDGSTDKSYSLLQKLSDENPDIDVQIISKINEGPAKARRIGFDNSNGEFLFFLDVDDILVDNALETLVANILNFDIVIGQSVMVDDKMNVLEKSDYSIKGSAIHSFLRLKLPFSLWPSLYRKKIFKGLDFGEVYTTGEDFYLNCQLYSDLKNKVKVIPETVHHYLRHESSITSNTDLTKYKSNFYANFYGLKKIEENLVEQQALTSQLEDDIICKKVENLYGLIRMKSPFTKQQYEHITTEYPLKRVFNQIDNEQYFDGKRLFVKLFFRSVIFRYIITAIFNKLRR